MDTRILQPGDFILFGGKSFISRGIKAFTDSKWSHVGMFIGNGYIIEATIPGVEKNLLAPLLDSAKNVAVVRIPNLTVENMELMKAKAYSMLGDKYDVWHLLTFAPYYLMRKLGISMPILVGDKSGSVVCSEACAMFAMVIPVLFAKKLKMVTPETIYRSKAVEIVYER